ncbi:aminoglycoside N(3)-acetyltransferase (plasmid) [Maritalea myrionectae]|uniref:aminoglycoside N(3)-acetyltransferase n=1 Tax=Maritalea myrionectae TaxID=454601 RepID=A0A2R4MJT0_9HYPH|nr:HAD-IIIC family phosphatase [Maritalea myrionectae]AVX06241.1 aminoglycoside N(3)-acetyltransferase [Maritalea myrionectae]
MTVANREAFFSALHSVLGNKPGLAVIHSSLAALAPPGGLEKWDALYAIDQLVRMGWTLVFPAFTFSFTRTGRFDCRNTPSETGILADWVKESFPQATRTRHPIYSFVVVGSLKQEISNCVSRTTFGDTSPFALFEKYNASIVMLGATWSSCTPFHRYEELAEVPYRHFKEFNGEIIRDGERINTKAVMYVRDLDLDARNDWSNLVQQLRSHDAIQTTPLWRAQIEATTMGEIAKSARSLLSDDPLSFIGNAAEVRHRLELRVEAARLEPFRIALLGSSNLDIAGHELMAQLKTLLPGRRCINYLAPFGQLGQQIMNSGSALWNFSAELTIFADRIEDLLGLPALDLAEPENALDAVQDYANLVCHYAKTNGGTIVVHRFSTTHTHNVERMNELRNITEQANKLLEDQLQSIPGVIWIDLATEYASGTAPYDPRLWHLGRIPYTKAFTAKISKRWAGIVLAQLGKTVRLLVLDLDNTMWGGVLGEDGPEGILLGGDFPGNAFSYFQRTIKSLAARGLALAVCSKNDESLALDVLENHAAMILRPDDLVAYRVNWQPKWQNIREIALSLDLGLESVMFIDDNPVEREAIKLNLPMVKVLDLPQDPTFYTDALLASPFLEVLQTGKEDRKRVASYKARQKINLERSSAASMEDFLCGLQMQLFIQPLNGDNITRAAQLCQKTNQFNTTTRRYSARDLDEMKSSGCDVAVVGLQDKFSERENIGLIILRPDREESAGVIDLFLMSCRVLGRTVETAVLNWASTRAHNRGWVKLRGEIIETPRNTPVRNVFEENGFHACELPGHWERNAAPALIPDWFALHDQF